MDRGYVHLWRKSLDSVVFKDQALWKLWTWCLMKANHKPKVVIIKIGRGNTTVKLKRGQFIFGRNSAAKELDMKPTSVRKRMLKLKKLQKCDIKSDTHFSIVTVLNYDQFNSLDFKKRQPKGQASDRQVTGKGQASDTTNNDKHYKHYKNKRFVQPSFEEVKKYCLERKNDIDPQYWLDKQKSIGWVVGKSKTPMKDWKASIRTWERNNFSTGRIQKDNDYI